MVSFSQILLLGSVAIKIQRISFVYFSILLKRFLICSTNPVTAQFVIYEKENVFEILSPDINDARRPSFLCQIND